MACACCVCFYLCLYSPVSDMNVRICSVHRMEHKSAQTRPWFIFSLKRMRGVQIYINSKGKISSIIHVHNAEPTILNHAEQQAQRTANWAILALLSNCHLDSFFVLLNLSSKTPQWESPLRRLASGWVGAAGWAFFSQFIIKLLLAVLFTCLHKHVICSVTLHQVLTFTQAWSIF